MEEKEFERLKTEYQLLLASTNSLYNRDPVLLARYQEERNQFEQEFVAMNCELQNYRSEIHQLRESNSYNEKYLADIDAEIKQKRSICTMLEDRINELATSALK